MTDTSGNSGTPYSFDKSNPAASLAQSAGKGIKGFFLGKSKTYNTLLGHELRRREMEVGSELKQNEMRTQGEVEGNLFKTKLDAGVKGAGELNKVAEPGTKADLSDRGVQYTTPGSKVEKVANVIETAASLVGGPAGRLVGKGLGRVAGRGSKGAAKLAEIRNAAAAAAPVAKAAAGAAKKAASNKTSKPAAKPKAAPKASAPKPTAKPAPKKGRAK